MRVAESGSAHDIMELSSASQTDVMTDIFELSNYVNGADAKSLDELKGVVSNFAKGILSIVAKVQRSVVSNSSQGSLHNSGASTASMPASSVSPSPVQFDLLIFTAISQATCHGSIQHAFKNFQCPVCPTRSPTSLGGSLNSCGRHVPERTDGVHGVPQKVRPCEPFQ